MKLISGFWAHQAPTATAGHLLLASGKTTPLPSSASNGIAKLANPIIYLMQSAAHPVAVIMLLYAGFLFMTGQPAKAIKVGKYAVIGYIAIQWLPMLMHVVDQAGQSVSSGSLTGMDVITHLRKP